MATPNQKAAVRPISFVYHNLASGQPPLELKLVLRPEDLTRTEPSRITTHQTLGGAWADNFGEGIQTVNIAGHTGWGQGDLPNGQEVFLALHELVYKTYHATRQRLIESGNDPDAVKLIFRDQLDDFTWVVAPTQFILQRSKSRPLLSQYKISLTKISDDVSETLNALSLTDAQKQKLALSSLDAVLKALNDFAKSLSAEINAFFGPLWAGVTALVNITNTVLGIVKSVISSGFLVIDTLTSNIFGLAKMLTFAASNVFSTVLAVQSIPGRIMARITRARTLYLNAYCILQNTFKSRKMLKNYDDVYGASLCSSTNGGRPLSIYLNSNTFEKILPNLIDQIGVTQQAGTALTSLIHSDPVLNPLSLNEVGHLSGQVANGVMVA